ncbi:MAG TPA: plastocyanin/azurin family copper-binding protein [Solirubrobacteraceae bacterium]|nr:plastocyanin/azurin family copper-binding protein [Solirubrobacteraceae bacterium]
MNRRLAVAVAATAVLALAATGVASTAGAANKNEIRIVGGEKFKAGKYLKIDLRFKPANVTVKSGSTVKLLNKGKLPEPHTISFVEKKYLPTSFEVAVDAKLREAHQVDPNNEDAPPGVLVVDNGVAVPAGGTLEADTMFTPTKAGDSAFIAPEQKSFSFKVTAKKGSRLHYYCAVHPWMQGKITVN